MLAAVVPFLEGEVGAMIGIAGGMPVLVAAIAAATGNFLSVLVVVLLTSGARSAVVNRHRVQQSVLVGAGSAEFVGEESVEDTSVKPESKGRARFKKWVVRFGVPGASILGPLAIPTQFTSAILVASGTPRGWVLLWQAVAIVIWTTIATVSVWAALTFVVGI
ncbi:small multidrug efflux protein [Gulosibacter sp.]|uniref:small multidrug efflux protein n=1 Tax=Gulosibacter sp. TaxID=2817531 RepID=UPI003F91F9B9